LKEAILMVYLQSLDPSSLETQPIYGSASKS